MARFSEVKKLYSEGDLLGTDEEGTEIDVNKISTALRTAGINLNEYFTGMKGLDEIFLELAQKWDSLTSVQQRYIATQAAGSRQQSRFIAMMSNYNRTVELVNAANNSAGASQEQFNKTLESMETLLAKLKNAWNEFTMGIANNEVLKTGVKILTTFLNILNSITNVLPGVASGFAKIALAWGGLKAGRAIFNSLLSSFGRAGKEGAISFRQSFQKEFGGKKGIFSIISKEISANKTDEYYAKLTPAINKYAASQKEAAVTQKLYNSVRKEGAGADILSAKATAASATAERDRAEAISLLSSAYGLEKAQAEQVLAITTLGINSDVAAAAVKNNLTKEMVEEMIAAEMNAGATRKEAAAKVESTLAEQYADSIRKKSLLSRLAAIIHTKAETIALNHNKEGLIGHTAALIADKTAQDASNASKLFALGIIGLIIAAIILLTVLIVKFVKSIANSTPTARLEQAKEAAEEAGKAAEEAAESFNTLKESLDGLVEKYKNLEGLTRGTQEWRQALIETNNAVLDLIEEYPELASLVANKDGVLTIDINSSEVQKVLDDYEDRQFKAESASYKAQMNVLEKQADVEYSNLEIDAVQFKDEEGIIAGADRELTEKIARGLAKGEITEDGVAGTQSINEFLDGTGLYMNTTESAVAALKAFGDTLLEADNKMGVFNSAITDNALAMLDQTKYSNKQMQQMSNFLDSDRIEKMTQNKLDELPDKYGDFSVEQKKAYEKFFKDTYGEDVEIGSDGKVTYKDENDKEVTIDSDIARELYAAAEATGDAASAAEEFSKALPKMSKSAQKIYSKEEGGALTLEDLSNLTGKTGKNFIDDILREIKNKSEVEFGEDGSAFYDEALAEWEKLGAEGQSVYSDFVEFQQEYVEAIQLSAERFNGYLKKLDPSIQAKVRQYDSEIVKNLSIQIAGMSDEEAKNYVSNFNKVLEKSNLGEEAKKSLESYLSTVDWSSMMQAINAVDFMENMGVDESIIDSYWQAAVDGANTYIKTIEEAGQLTEYFQNKAKTATEIKERLISGEATSEDLQELIDAGVDLTGQLQLTAKGWKMSGDAAEAATQKILENGATQAQMAVEQQEESYRKAIKIAAKGSGAGAEREGITKTEVDQTGKKIYITGDFEAADEDTKNLIASQLGVEKVKGETQEEYWERAKQAYLDYVDQLNNGEAINEIAGMNAAFANAQIYSADESASRGYDESTVRYSMQSEAERAGLDSGEVTDYSDYLMEVNNNLKYNQALSDRVAIANAKMNDGLKKLTDTYKDWNGLLDKNGKIRKNLSEEEATAYQQMKKDTAEMLGVNGELSDSFFENTNAMELLAKAAQGDTSALEQLQKLAAQDYIVSVLLDDESLDEDARSDLQELSNFIMNYDLPELEAGVELDDTNFINICNGLIRNSKLTAGQINEIFGRIGYKATLKPHTEYVKIPRMGANNTIVGWTSRAVQVYDLVTLTSSGSGGGGVTRTSPKTSGGGGGGGSSNKSKDWENPYDHLYNLTEKINNSLRIREKLERDYDRILSNRSKNAEDIYNNMMKQIGALEREKKLQEEMLSKRKKEATDTMKKNSALNKYAWIEYDKSGNAYVQINWDLIDKVKDEEKGQKIEDYVSDLEEVRDQINDANDGLDDIEDRLGEIYELGKDEYFDFEDKVLEAIVADRQKAIDELSAINDSINDTNQKIIDSIQSEIDKVRQDRENEKKEEEISDKQRRLAYLQMDTSGANQVEILKLQDEIQEAQEDYTDTLIDQKISELQEQNDKAAEQRETQIQIMERQLEHDQETGALWTEAYALIKEGVDENGKLIQGSRLEQLLQSTDGYAGLSNIGKMNWLNDIEESLKLVVNYLRVGRSTEGLLSTGELTAGQTITFTTGSGQVATGTVRENGKVTDASGNVYSGVYQDYSGKFVTEEGFMGVTGAQKNSFDKLVESGVINTPDYWVANQGKIEYLPELIDRLANSVSSVDSNIYSTAESAIDALYKSGVINSPDYWKSNYKKLEYLDLLLIRAANHLPIGLTHYKTGGVADFTGPAWLDGTPSKPEIILNQKDSQNFIQLKDILANILSKGNNGTSENNGDNYFDVDINVESLSEDYDIERVAEDVKNLIVKDATYRNVNAINRLR